MGDPDRRGERTVALALLGAVLFSRPVLDGFGAAYENLILGIPSLYFYLFVAWAVLIGLLAMVMESRDGLETKPSRSSTSEDGNGPGTA